MAINLKELSVLSENPVFEVDTPIGKILVYQTDLLFVPAAVRKSFVAVSYDHGRVSYGKTPEEASNLLRYLLRDKTVYQ